MIKKPKMTNDIFEKTYRSSRECKATCKHCGYTAVMSALLDEKICQNCGHKLKNNSKARFRYIMREKLKNEI